MKLKLGTFAVTDVVAADRTFFNNGTLSINVEEITSIILADNTLEKAEIHIVKPNENKRIVHVLDALEPRIKLDDMLSAFPGEDATLPYTVGSGTTYRLEGLAVMTSALLPIRAGGLLIPREAIVDMVGPGRHYSPFYRTINIVLSLGIADGYSDIEYERAVRRAGVIISKYLAETTRNLEPDLLEEWTNEKQDPNLPNIVYIHQYQSQGTNAYTYSYGKHMFENLPTLLNPNELLDGAMVSSNFAYGCFKTPTYLHCNNPVLWELYKGHGKIHNFAGVVISRGHNYTFAEKLRSAQFAAKIAKEIGAHGAVITWEGGGNSIIEAMQTVRACENIGVKTVIIGYELGGPLGDELALLDSVEEADAIVSTGSIDKAVSLPELEPIGGEHLRLSPETGGKLVPARGPLEFPIAHEMYCGSGHTGFGYLTSREY